ncbi:MAG: hypothetical protein DSZ00_08585 [Gammaproteobacteria bacterium]|nr:MAG: hypothetical protein DSZ00_08585 [Gammaproteobacteria bacterium]
MDGTLIEALASLKSYRSKDEDEPPNLIFRPRIRRFWPKSCHRHRAAIAPSAPSAAQGVRAREARPRHDQ